MKSERKQIPHANTYIWNPKKEKKLLLNQGQDRNKYPDIENGLEYTRMVKCKLGQSERVAWTYIHYHV